MSAKICPNCKLLVDERHRYCECGYDWHLDRMRPGARRDSRSEIRFTVWIFAGLLIAIVVLLELLKAIAALIGT